MSLPELVGFWGGSDCSYDAPRSTRGRTRYWVNGAWQDQAELKEDTMGTRVNYRGDGTESVSGVPPRNLSQEEYLALTDEQRQQVGESPLYQVKPAAAMDEYVALDALESHP